jgi:AcrR family transcriptional regulator
MVENLKKTDRRIQRTQQLLRDALMELIVEKGYEAISVQDITDHANVARTTFYLHYQDKEQLLLNSITEIYDELVANLEKEAPRNGLLPDGTPADVIVFRHVQEYPDFYRVMLVKPGVPIFINRARHYLADLFTSHIEMCFPAQTLPQHAVEFVAQRDAGALIGVVSWWLENGMELDSETMAHMFYASSQKGIWETIGVAPPEEMLK